MTATFRGHERPRKTLGFETPAERLMPVSHRPVEIAPNSGRSNVGIWRAAFSRVQSSEEFTPRRFFGCYASACPKTEHKDLNLIRFLNLVGCRNASDHRR